MTRQHIVQRACSLGVMLLGCIFLWAAVSKISDLDAFANILKKMIWLPTWILAVALFMVPSVELIVGLCLLCKIALKEAVWVSLLLLTIFTFVSVQGALTGTHGCGCLKIGKTSLFDGVSGWWIVARDAVLTLACAVIALNPRNVAKIDNMGERSSSAEPSSFQT
jgi:hypothetical protein